MENKVQKKKNKYSFDKRSVPGIVVFVFFIIIGIGLFFFWKDKRDIQKEEQKVTIAVTTLPIYNFFSKVSPQIDQISLYQVVPNSEVPETYKLNEEEKRKVKDADYVVKIGAGYDDWIDEFVGQEAKLVDLSQLIDVKKQTRPHPDFEKLCIENNGTWLDMDMECENMELDRCKQFSGSYNDCASPCRNDPTIEACIDLCVPVCSFSLTNSNVKNPYYWLSIENAKKITAALYTILAEENIRQYNQISQNYKNYINSLDETKDYIKEEFAQLEETKIYVATNVFDYFTSEFEIDSEFVSYVPGRNNQLVILSDQLDKTIYVDQKTSYSTQRESLKVVSYDIYDTSQGQYSYIDTLRGLADVIVEEEGK